LIVLDFSYFFMICFDLLFYFFWFYLKEVPFDVLYTLILLFSLFFLFVFIFSPIFLIFVSYVY